MIGKAFKIISTILVKWEEKPSVECNKQEAENGSLRREEKVWSGHLENWKNKRSWEILSGKAKGLLEAIVDLAKSCFYLDI